MTNLGIFQEVTQQEFLDLLNQPKKSRAKQPQKKTRKRALFTHPNEIEKKSPYLLDKLAQLSQVLNINVLSDFTEQICSNHFSPKKDHGFDPLESPYFFPLKPCELCKISVKSKIRVERPGQPVTYKKILPRPKLILIRKYAHTISIDKGYLKAKKEQQYQDQKKDNKYLFLHVDTKQETNKKQLDQDQKTLWKKAKAKHFTFSIVSALSEIESPLNDGYKRSLECASELSQNRDKITAKYCKNRWCITCNRIRTAKLINGYTPVLSEFGSPQLLTLTIPNMAGNKLPDAIKAMQHVWREIYKMIKRPKSFKKFEAPIQGLKKLECTYNPTEDTFHPHYHFITESEVMAELLLNSWVKYWNGNGFLPKQYKTAPLSMNAQKYKPIKDQGGFLELFKYFTKVISKADESNLTGIYIHPMDTIFQAMYKKRTFEPIGIKAISEDIDELQSEIFSHLAHETKIWQWFETDWICGNETLTNYKPDQNLLKLLENIII